MDTAKISGVRLPTVPDGFVRESYTVSITIRGGRVTTSVAVVDRPQG